MKKLMLFVTGAFVLLLLSCGSDDDGGDNCSSCEVAGIPVTICDNGDRTATISITGTTTTTVDSFRDGETFAEFVERSCDVVVIP